MPDWDVVYAEKNIEDAKPADILIMNEHLLNARSADDAFHALDYACGLGGNAQYLAKKGFQVSAWDRSATAIEKISQFAKQQALPIDARVYDLENDRPEIKNKFDVIVVSFFLHRKSLRYLFDLLKTNGILFYQTFSGEPVDGQGPSNENFRLTRNELLTIYSDMQLLFYREDDECITMNGKNGLTYFVAKK